MADENLIKAVEEVRRASRQRVISDACDQALRTRTNTALRAALITTRERGTTWVAKGIANRALGLEE